MIILAIETARDVCSVSVEVDGAVASSMTRVEKRSHAEWLVPMTLETLTRAGLSLPNVDAVAVSAGPGSYTGLRIGVSTAKGFCVAHGARLVGVSTLRAHACAIQHKIHRREDPVDVIAVAFRSRRDEVYFGAFGSLDLVEAAPPLPLALREAARWIREQSESAKLVVGGDGAEDVLTAAGTPQEVKLVRYLPLADHVAVLGRKALNAGHVDDTDRFEPYYLKDYIAGTPTRTVFDRLPF